MDKPIQVTIAYVDHQHQLLIPVKVPKNTTIKEAIECSGICQQGATIDLDHLAVGIFGRLKTLENIVQHDDRIELYRPLVFDPKDARRRRLAANQKD